MTGDCKVDHSTLSGKFCPSCGSIRIDEERTCSQGHTMSRSAKFCPNCGSEPKSRESLCSNGHPKIPESKFCNVCGVPTNNSIPPTKKLSNQNRKIEVNSIQNVNSNLQAFPPSTPIQLSYLDSQFPSQGTASEFGKEKSNKNFLIGGISALVLLLFGIVLIGSSNSGSESVTVTVQMVLTDQYDCFDISWGYSDIPGGQVVLDVDGTKYFGSYPALGETSASGCRFTAFISGVDSEGMNYSISMASGRRGTIYSSKSELEANDWTFFLSLG